MKKNERALLRLVMYVTAIFLWFQSAFIVIAPLGYLTLIGVDPMANSVMAGIRVIGVPIFLIGLLAWDAARKPPKHIRIAALLAGFFLASAAVRAGSMTLEGETGTIANPILICVEALFGLAHAGWYLLWSDRKKN